MSRALTDRESELGEALLEVLGASRFEELTTGETMDVISRFCASFLASAANTEADEAALISRSEVFRTKLTEFFGAFALMLADQMYTAAGNGPLAPDPLDWLRREMESSNG